MVPYGVGVVRYHNTALPKFFLSAINRGIVYKKSLQGLCGIM